MAVIQNLGIYKKNGCVDLQKVLKIPPNSRIPELIKTFGMEKIHATITARLRVFVNSYNVVRPMSSTQMVSAAAAIMDSAHQDDLAIEDLLLFFDGAMKNQYGRVLDHLDQHVLFEMFDKYREERYKVFRHAQRERETQYKALGDTNRLSDSSDNHLKDVEFLQHLSAYNNQKRTNDNTAMD